MKQVTSLLILQLLLLTSQGQIAIKRISLSNGTELEYAEKGKRAASMVVFLHGYSDSWHSFEQVMKLFPGEFHLVALTLRGHGNSSKPAGGYYPRDFANDVALFIKEQKAGASIIVGHSMGGVIAQQFAIDHPELTKAVILVDTDAKFADNPGFPEFIQQVLEFQKPADYSFAKEFQLSTLAKPIDSAQLALFINESLKLPLHVWKETGKGLLAADLENGLRAVKSPVLIVFGTQDNFCSKADQDKLKSYLQKSELIIYEGTGHALHWEEPARFVTDVIKFINQLK